MCPLGRREIKVVPAHFLHSSGSFPVYDPTSKVLYTGDLVASTGAAFGRSLTSTPTSATWEASTSAIWAAPAPKLWLDLVRTLDIETIAAQHGAMMCGKPVLGRFLAWLDGLEVGA